MGGKMTIFAFEVDKLEELYETPYGGLERWQLQLGEEDEGYLRWLRVAQMGDRPYCELTLEGVTLDPARVSRSTWKFLVCKGRQMTETVWLTAVRAWNMPVSRLSAEATRDPAGAHGETQRLVPGEAVQRSGAAAGRLPGQDREHAGDCPPWVPNGEETARDELPQTGRGDRH